MNSAHESQILRMIRIHVVLALTVACGHVRLAAQEARPPLTVEEVVTRMVAMSERRNEALRSYSSIRNYSIDFRGVKHLHAEMSVSINYQWPNTKELTILSESGSGTLRNRALRPLLQAELEAMKPENPPLTALSPQNYSFQMVGYTKTDAGDCYILEVRPRHKNKFLFKGKIWVEDKGFAVTRIVGEPAVNPSFWIAKTDFQRNYQKIGDFWLPESNQSKTKVRVFGTAVLTIDYGKYEITKALDVNVADSLEKPPNGAVREQFRCEESIFVCR